MTRIAGWLRIPAALPWRALYLVAGALAWLLRRVVRFRLAIVRVNLRRCFPEMDDATLGTVIARHYRDMTGAALEMFKLATLDADGLRARVVFRNPEVVHTELQAGRSAMLLTAHQGNWEWLLQRLAVEYRPFICAYKPLRSARFDGDLLVLRTRFGAQMVPAKGLIRALLRARGAHLTALAADQMPSSSPSRVWLPFMGQPTAFYPGPGEIAARYGYGAWFMAMQRLTNGYYEVEFQPIATAGEKLNATEFTRRYAACVEAQLRRAPSDWAWGHRRWKLEPPVESQLEAARLQSVRPAAPGSSDETARPS
jgi:KDO2-lipid IV(A) lauroyltransferase